MTRGLRAVAAVILAIWMVPGIASFAVGVHLLVEHHDHDGVPHDGQSALEDGHQHSPATSADQLHEIVPARRLADAGAFIATAMIGKTSLTMGDLRPRSAAQLPPRLIPSDTLLHTLCTLLI